MKNISSQSSPEKSFFQERLLSFFFPPRCAVCGEPGYAPLCPLCEKAMADAFQPKAFLAYGGNGYADKMNSLFPYRKRAPKKLILLWKSRDLEELPQIFLPYIQKWYGKEKIKAPIVTFIPRRQAAKWKNGFDQAEKLALSLANGLNLPFEALLSRHGFSRKQHNLPREKRQKNVAGVFRPKRPLAGETILLVDDIVTSGASAREAARVLKNAGAQKVFVFSLAH